MLPTISRNKDRVLQTREKLLQLRTQGYGYLVTTDDGDTWVGSHERGLDIEDLIHRGFIGQVVLGMVN